MPGAARQPGSGEYPITAFSNALTTGRAALPGFAAAGPGCVSVQAGSWSAQLVASVATHRAPKGLFCACSALRFRPLDKLRNRRSGSMRPRERLRSNCRCDVSISAESWKIMHSCAYMRPGATSSIRQMSMPNPVRARTWRPPFPRPAGAPDAARAARRVARELDAQPSAVSIRPP
jgi:hypothetical protein